MWRIGKSSFIQQSFPTKTAGTMRIVLLALDLRDSVSDIALKDRVDEKAMFFSSKHLATVVFSVFSKSVLLWQLI